MNSTNNTQIKFFPLVKGTDLSQVTEDINAFIATGIQLMPDGLQFFPDYVMLMYRGEDLLGMTVYAMLEKTNGQIKMVQEKILASLGKLREVTIAIDTFEGTEESKKALIDSKANEMASLKKNRLILADLVKFYASIKNGEINLDGTNGSIM